jgi:CMP-N-acetylneuraminic acid synthetase
MILMFKYCMIGARSGSETIKNKNIQKVNGRALLSISIQKALKCNVYDKIYVSSDCAAYKDFLPHNSIVEFVLRPTEISQNTSTEIEYLSHIIKTRNLKKNSLISRMQCTSPFQSVASMKLSVEKLEAHLTKFDSVQLVSPSSPSIHKAMLKCEKSGLLSPATNLGSIGPSNRQNLEKTYFRSNFYVTSVQQILSGNLLGSRSYGLECEEREVIDIDAHFDLEIVRALAVSNTDWLEM